MTRKSIEEAGLFPEAPIPPLFVGRLESPDLYPKPPSGEAAANAPFWTPYFGFQSKR
jgi:hypothetical protein